MKKVGSQGEVEEGSRTPHPLSMCCVAWFSSKECSMESGWRLGWRKSSVPVEKSDKHCLQQRIRTSRVIGHVDSLNPWYDDISHLWSSSPKLIIQSVLMQTSSLIKRSGHCQCKVILQSVWPVLLATVKVIKSKKSLRNCHSQEESKETS